MLITDMNFLTSDNPKDNYKELHDYAASFKLNHGWHYSTRGRPYYNIKRKKLVRQNLLLINCIIIKKHTMKVYLLSGYLKIRVETDFGRYKVHKQHAKWLISICTHNGIEKVAIKYIQTRTNAAYCISKYKQKDLSYIVLISNNKYPNGKAYISGPSKENAMVKELLIPKEVTQGHIENVKTTPLRIARNRTKVL